MFQSFTNSLQSNKQTNKQTDDPSKEREVTKKNQMEITGVKIQ